MITATTRSSLSAPRARRVRSIELHGPAGRLEAVLNEGSPDAACAAVVCHPHPLGGGSLHNKVVYHASRSEGEHDGAAEAGDVLAALTWLENEYKLPLVAAGFSFGAAMVLAACCGSGSIPCPKSQTWGTQSLSGAPQNLRAVAALGLPVRSGIEAPRYDYGYLAHCRIPKLFLSGDNDRFAKKSELIEIVAAAAEPKRVALVPGADHFFTGQLEFMQSYLSGWLKEQVYDPGQRPSV